jgi:hypothetical protein
VAPAERAVKPRVWHGPIDGAAKIPLIPAHSASLRAFTPVFDGLWTRVNALMAGIQGRALGPCFRGDERKRVDGERCSVWGDCSLENLYMREIIRQAPEICCNVMQQAESKEVPITSGQVAAL